MLSYAIIPARSGSKGVKNKNVRPINGKPLILYTIEAALKSKLFDRVIVSTDSQSMADLAKEYGAEAPFIRPNEFAQDHSPDRAYLEHALNWFQENEKQEPDLIAILRPTTPLRESALLDQAIQALKENPKASSLRSVHALAEPPQKMLQIVDGWLTGFFPSDTRDDYFNLPRQAFPTAYQPNGYIDIVRSDFIRSEKEKIFGSKILSFVTPHSVEIDNEEDLNYLDYIVKTQLRT